MLRWKSGFSSLGIGDRNFLVISGRINSDRGVGFRFLPTCFIIVKIVILLICSICLAHAEEPLHRKARHEAMEIIQQRAIEAKMPAGRFGVKWLMSREEVQAARPNAGPADEKSYFEVMEVYGRKAVVAYAFDKQEESLIMILITFNGRVSDEEYGMQRQKLIDEFGEMPVPAAKEGLIKSSSKKKGGFTVSHLLREVSGIQGSQILLYKSNG